MILSLLKCFTSRIQAKGNKYHPKSVLDEGPRTTQSAGKPDRSKSKRTKRIKIFCLVAGLVVVGVSLAIASSTTDDDLSAVGPNQVD